MLPDAAVVADHQLGRIDKGEARTASPAGLQIRRQGNEDGRDQLHEATVTDEPREVRTQVSQDMLGVIGFEIPGMRLGKVNQDRHDFAFRKLTEALWLDLPAVEQGLLPAGSESQPEIIDTAEQFE